LKSLEIKTPQEFFEKVLPDRFKPEKAAGIDAKVQLTLTGLDGGEWVVTVKDKKIQVTEGIDSSATLKLKMSEEDFLDMINGKLKAEKAFFTGKIQFNGNISMALKLKDAGFL
jgi:putative sterol carrier protein